MQVARNCEGRHPESGFVLALAGDLVVEECPISALDPRALYLYKLFHGCHYATATREGVARAQHTWPHPGGLNEQLAIVVDAFQVIRSEYARIAQEALDEHARTRFLQGEAKPKERR